MNTLNFEVGRTYNAIYRNRKHKCFDNTFTVLSKKGKDARMRVNVLFSSEESLIFPMGDEQSYPTNLNTLDYDIKDVTELPDEWIRRVRFATLNEIVEAVGIDVVKIRYTNEIPLSWNINEFQGAGKTIYYAAFSAFALEECWKAKERFGNDRLIFACDTLDDFKVQITSIIPNALFILESEYHKY